MSKEYLEALGKNIRYKKEYIGNDTYRLYIKKNGMEFLEQALQRLESIEKSNSSEAIRCLSFLKDESINDIACLKNSVTTKTLYQLYFANFDTIEQALIKAQELKSENNALLEENKDLYFELELAEKKYKELIEYAKKQEKVLSIIKELKRFGDNINDILEYDTYEDYINSKCDWGYELTQEEFELLKRWIG